MRVFIDGIIFSLQRHGGVSVYFRKLIDSLILKDVSVSLSLNTPIKQNLDLYEKTLPTVSHSSRFLERYRNCIVPPNFSVFHSSYYRMPRDHSLPVVVTVHDFTYERYQRGLRRWVHSAQKNASIRSAQAVICISETTRQDFIEYIGETPGQKVHVIHNGVSDVFRKINVDFPLSNYLLFVGQRGGYKNFSRLLDAMVFLPDFQLYCVGGGEISKDEVEGLPEDVIRRIRYFGFVSDEKLNELYNNALCLVYPSSYEGFGIPVLEAMRAGCPVVCVNCKAVLEVGGGALIVADDLNPRSIAQAIDRAVSSDRVDFINRGLIISQKYSWDITHNETLNVYRSFE